MPGTASHEAVENAMKRINDEIDGPLLFSPYAGTGYECNYITNPEFKLETGQLLYQSGVYTNGFLETNTGRKVDAAIRKSGSYVVHLVTTPDYSGKSIEPIRLFPDTEVNREVSDCSNFFDPYFNCHGCTFAESKFWLNPVKYDRDMDGKVISADENVNWILEDDYHEVNESDNWDVAVFCDSQSEIVHSVRRNGDVILCKYDNYQLVQLSSLSEMDFSRYTIDRSRDRFFIESSD